MKGPQITANETGQAQYLVHIFDSHGNEVVDRRYGPRQWFESFDPSPLQLRHIATFYPKQPGDRYAGTIAPAPAMNKHQRETIGPREPRRCINKDCRMQYVPAWTDEKTSGLCPACDK